MYKIFSCCREDWEYNFKAKWGQRAQTSSECLFYSFQCDTILPRCRTYQAACISCMGRGVCKPVGNAPAKTRQFQRDHISAANSPALNLSKMNSLCLSSRKGRASRSSFSEHGKFPWLPHWTYFIPERLPLIAFAVWVHLRCLPLEFSI